MERAVGARATPEMLFDSSLTLTHGPSGTTLRFVAEDALRSWMEADLPAVKVAAAATWNASHVERFGGRGGGGDDDGWRATEASESYDWTFTTPYGGTVTSTSGRDAPEWRPTARSIDRAMLTARDPILFYDELTLYESEFDDHGAAHLGLKIRVMPKCWYVLLRFWLRVDGVLIRLYETRFFCDVSAPDAVVVRETTRREETWDQLRARGAPSEPRQYPNADDAASALLASGGPVTMFAHELALARP